MTIQNISDSITSLLKELGVDEKRQEIILDGTLDVIIKNLNESERTKLGGIVDEDDLASVGGGAMENTKRGIVKLAVKVSEKLHKFGHGVKEVGKAGLNEVGKALIKLGDDFVTLNEND